MEQEIKDIILNFLKTIINQIKFFVFGILTIFALGILLLIFLGVYTAFHVNTKPENIPVQEVKKENIYVFQPLSGAEISTPLVVKGEARGNWYFEASFPVVLTDWDGLIIASGVATAEGNWMTTDFVPFTATLDFTKPNYGSNGSLILKKDNPSGLPENDDSLEIMVKFK